MRLRSRYPSPYPTNPATSTAARGYSSTLRTKCCRAAPVATETCSAARRARIPCCPRRVHRGTRPILARTSAARSCCEDRDATARRCVVDFRRVGGPLEQMMQGARRASRPLNKNHPPEHGNLHGTEKKGVRPRHRAAPKTSTGDRNLLRSEVWGLRPWQCWLGRLLRISFPRSDCPINRNLAARCLASWGLNCHLVYRVYPLHIYNKKSQRDYEYRESDHR